MRNVVIIEDSESWSHLIQDRLEKTKEFKVAAKFKVGKSFFQAYAGLPEIHLILLDLDLPGENGLEIAYQLKRVCPEIPFILFSQFHSTSVQCAFQELGAKAVIPKTMAATLGQEVMNALGIGPKLKYSYVHLDFDEMQLLTGICSCLTNKELATLLNIEETTVEYRCRMLASKLKIKNKKLYFMGFAMRFGYWFPENLERSPFPNLGFQNF